MGLWDFLSGDPKPNAAWLGPNKGYSVDWCRYRRYSHCFFTDLLDEAATPLAGYRVYVPVDRGYCIRVKSEHQKACPVSQPGANVEGGYIDATVPWEAGGQRIPPTPEERHYIPSFNDKAGIAVPPDPLNADGTEPSRTPESVGSMARSNSLQGHLLSLRTAGVISMTEFKLFAERISPQPVKSPPSKETMNLSALEHVVALKEAGLLSPEECEPLERRVGSPSGEKSEQEPVRDQGADPSRVLPTGPESATIAAILDSATVRALERQAVQEIFRSLQQTPAQQENAPFTPDPDTPSHPSSQDGHQSYESHGIGAQLAELAALHQSGDLSDDEFIAAKRRVLDAD